MLLLRRPADGDIRAFIAAQAALPFSYEEVGATGAAPPAWATVDHNRAVLGCGPEIFERAVAALRGWRMFAFRGVELCWPDAPVAAGTTVAILARVGPAWILNACRIVYAIEEPDRVGFAYGTLPDHPVRGEERFLVERGAGGEVAYDILAFSRPASLPLSLGRPLLRRAQRQFATASKAAMRRAVAADLSG
jgi:uncharacterized protein (UPF0548 family)